MRLLLLSLLLIALPASGASITDRLLAGLYAEASSTSEPLRVLPSDTPLEVLEQSGRFSRVRLGDNSEGWVESRYITEQKSARLQLLELQARHGALRSRLRDAERLLLELQRAAGAPALPTPATTAEVAAPATMNPWLPALVALLMVLSFIAGIAFKNYRIARRG